MFKGVVSKFILPSSASCVTDFLLAVLPYEVGLTAERATPSGSTEVMPFPALELKSYTIPGSTEVLQYLALQQTEVGCRPFFVLPCDGFAADWSGLQALFRGPAAPGHLING
eukprot:scaffold226497_cov18-Tisochrysis_lutea.AAC.1